MRKCKKCGFLVKFARFFEWRSDGTIVSTNLSRTKVRIMFLEVGEMISVFDELSRVMGKPVNRTLIEAERNIGKAFLADTPIGFVKHMPRNRFLRPRFLAKAMIRIVRKDIAGLGCGVVSVEDYRAGKYLTLRFANPYFVPGTVGNTLGVFELIEGIKSANYEYDVEDNGDLVVRYSDSGKPGRSLLESRFYIESAMRSTGLISYDRCKKCGTPLDVAGALRWNMRKGIITNRFTGERVAVGSPQSVNAMLWKLADEFGEDVIGILYDAQKGRSIRDLKDLSGEAPVEFWERYLLELALKGLGYPEVFNWDEGGISVEIRTAYNQTLYAARIAAALESMSGLSSEILWEKRKPNLGIYTISATG